MIAEYLRSMNQSVYNWMNIIQLRNAMLADNRLLVNQIGSDESCSILLRNADKSNIKVSKSLECYIINYAA